MHGWFLNVNSRENIKTMENLIEKLLKPPTNGKRDDDSGGLHGISTHLSADLISTLTSLQMNDFTHFHGLTFSREFHKKKLSAFGFIKDFFYPNLISLELRYIFHCCKIIHGECRETSNWSVARRLKNWIWKHESKIWFQFFFLSLSSFFSFPPFFLLTYGLKCVDRCAYYPKACSLHSSLLVFHLETKTNINARLSVGEATDECCW